MRPYFAIIKDSFRAAMASRVLYVLLLLITLLLLALAPFHIRETLDWKLQRQVNVSQPDELVQRLVARHESDKRIGRIWELLSPDLQKRMIEEVSNKEEPDSSKAESDAKESDAKDSDAKDSDVNVATETKPSASDNQRRRRGGPPGMARVRLHDDLVEELNGIIEDKTFYREADWHGSALPTEAEKLIDQGVAGLPEIRAKRLNRLLIANTVSPTVSPGNATAMDFYYAIWQTPITLSITHQQFAQILTSELPVYFDKFVMSIGLFIAIVVTANMVPETFEPGSLNLLLSKPISRWGLYTSKFIGGCVFIALCAAYLFFGVWLWLGLGMGIWDRAMLFSIPLYVLVFAIYFSVSAFIGLLWRSPIVAVILTLLFWAACFSIGSVFGVLKTKINNGEFVHVLPVGDQVYATDIMRQMYRWDSNANQWTVGLAADLGQDGEMMIGMQSYFVPLRELAKEFPPLSGMVNSPNAIHDSHDNQILANQFQLEQSFFGSKKLQVSNADQLNFSPSENMPRGTLTLVDTPQDVVAVTSGGLFYRLIDVSKDKADSADKADSDNAENENSEAVASKSSAADKKELAKKSNNKKFRRFGPTKPFSVTAINQIAYHRQSDEFALYSGGTLNIYRRADDGYQQTLSKKLELSFDRTMTGFVAHAGDVIAIGFGNGKILTLDADSLERVAEFQPETRSAIRQISASTTGAQIGVLYRNGNLWLIDTAGKGSIELANVVGQGQVSAFAFGAAGELWVAENMDRVTRYDLKNGSRIKRLAPRGTLLEQGYRFALRPLYRVFPKPGEFYKVVTYLSSSGDTSSNENVDLNRTIEASDPWSPLWSGLGFMIGMLLLGCLVFQFKDY